MLSSRPVQKPRSRLVTVALVAALTRCGAALPEAPPAPTPIEPTSAPIAASPTPDAAGSDAGAPVEPRAGLAPLDGAPFAELPVEGHRAAVVALPLGATTPRPLFVATHGAGGAPEPTCAFWRDLLGAGVFILCPRGVPLGSVAAPDEQGFFYPDHHALAREVTDAMAALRARFGAHLDDRAPIYAGFSQGATMGALAFVKRPAVFARLVLIEGGVGEAGEWTFGGARALREGGGERVLLACGRPGCADTAKRTVTYFDKAGLAGRVAYGAGAGHTYGGAVGAAIRDALPWLLEGDPRFGER